MLVWLVAAVLLVALAQRAGENTNDNLSLPGTGSNEATSLLQQRFPNRANPAVPLLLRAPSGTLEDQRYASAIAATASAYAKNPHVAAVVSPLSPQGAGLLSKDRTIGYISLTLRDSPSELSVDEARALYDEAAPARAAGLQAEAGGYLGQKLSKPSTESSEAVGLTMAVIVLLATFGTAVLMGIPIVTAILGLAVALSTITLLGHATDVPRIAPTLATMIGLGVGIDYALFLLTRHTHQVGNGMDVDESIARAVASDGGAIVFAGVTVVIAICSLALAGIPLVSVLGYTAALAVLTRCSRRSRCSRPSCRSSDFASSGSPCRGTDASRCRPRRRPGPASAGPSSTGRGSPWPSLWPSSFRCRCRPCR